MNTILPVMKPGFMILLPVLLLSCATGGKVVKNINPDTGLMSWKTSGQTFSMELLQLYPEYVRAVYASRGLPEKVIDKISSYCVFGTIIRNLSDSPVFYNIEDWRYVTADGKQHVARTKREWVNEWREMGIVFRWLLLPEAQTFAVGDWGQGFTTVKLAPGTVFDLHYEWQQDGKTHQRTIKEMHCATVPVAN